MKPPRIEVFRGRSNQWFWHVRATNGQITAQSEAYTRKTDARRAAEAFIAHPAVVDDVCRHASTTFSRTVCACGWMHDYCDDCGEQIGRCVRAVVDDGDYGVTEAPV